MKTARSSNSVEFSFGSNNGNSKGGDDQWDWDNHLATGEIGPFIASATSFLADALDDGGVVDDGWFF